MRVSIGISFLNNKRTLVHAIRSVFAQTIDDWELLLVDDGSSDGSLEIAQSVKDPRVRVLHDGQRRYLAARLNQIAAEAKYELVARMDADDIMFTERLEIQRRLFADSKINLVSSPACIINDANKIIGYRTYDYKTLFTPQRIINNSRG
ncbi:MAG: glycosyltransferase family 2 protein, partial [Planctomycetaceae bacterium]|nr:glycosyltransferase family 2 protein [Planctomycetaceae bacterium]